jgi:DNA-binding NarL/FixJ family response regulator
MINIALIHTQPLYRKGLSLLLTQTIDDFTVVASANDLRSLINRYKGEAIDVIVWDIPGHHVLTPGTRLLKECYPLAKILVLVASKNAVYAGLLETLGADKVISSDCELSDLCEIILDIHKSYAPPASSNHVQEPASEKARKPPITKSKNIKRKP